MLNKNSCLAPPLDVTKIITIIDMYKSHFIVLLESDLDVQQTHPCLLNKSSCLAPTLGAAKFIVVKDLILLHYLGLT